MNSAERLTKSQKRWLEKNMAPLQFGATAHVVYLYTKLTKKFGAPSKAQIAGAERPRAIYLEWIPKGITVTVTFEKNGLIGLGLFNPPVEDQDEEYTLRLMNAQRIIDDTLRLMQGHKKEGK